MGGSINGSTPRWMVYKEKSYLEMDDSGVPPFVETPILALSACTWRVTACQAPRHVEVVSKGAGRQPSSRADFEFDFFIKGNCNCWYTCIYMIYNVYIYIYKTHTYDILIYLMTYVYICIYINIYIYTHATMSCNAGAFIRYTNLCSVPVVALLVIGCYFSLIWPTRAKWSERSTIALEHQNLYENRAQNLQK